MSIAARIKNILLEPKSEWPVIDAEAASPGSLYMGYAVPLALIGPVASLIGNSVIGMNFMGTLIRIPLFAGVAMAVVGFALTLILSYVIARVVNALAPRFGGRADFVQALKTVVYSSTPGWIAGVAGIVPMLGTVAVVVALYSLALYWMGLPRLMKVPEAQKTGFNLTVLACAIVAYIAVSAAVAATGSFFGAVPPPPAALPPAL